MHKASVPLGILRSRTPLLCPTGSVLHPQAPPEGCVLLSGRPVVYTKGNDLMIGMSPGVGRVSLVNVCGELHTF